MKTNLVKIAVFSAVMAIVLSAFSTNPVLAEETKPIEFYKDVTEGNSWYVPIRYFWDTNVIDKTELFNPEKELTRAEAVSESLKVLLGYKPENKVTIKPFTDVRSDTYYSPFIEQAKKLGIVQGYSAEKFQPQKTVNTAEALKIILQTEKLQNSTLIFDKPSENVFADVSKNEWFSPYAKIAKDKRIVKFGQSDELNPSETVSRGYFYEILYRLIKSNGGNMYGLASYYSDSLEGTGTSSGDRFSNGWLTAAHKTLKFGTMVKVTNLQNGKSVEVKINDRGPFTKNFTIDLSQAAFEAIARKSQGIIPIEFTIISTP